MTPATVGQIVAIVTPQIGLEEGCKLSAYLDTATPPKWTIAWGRADSGVTRGMTCTQADADKWRDEKLMALCDDLEFHLPWWRTVGAVRAAVFLEMAYQMGVGGLMGFHDMLDSARAAKWSAAAADGLASAWALQTPARAHREMTQLRTGVVA